MNLISHFRIGSFPASTTASSSTRSSSISSDPHGPSRKSSSMFNEMFRRRASSYDHQKWAKEGALKIDVKRWQSYTADAEKTAPPQNLIDLLQNTHLNTVQSDFEAPNEPENLHSELMGFFDDCAMLIVKLMND